MSKKGNKKKQKEIRRHQHQEKVAVWHNAWRGGQRTGEGMQGVERPLGQCIVCKNSFTRTDAFHYSRIGPVHGWGNFEFTQCSLKKKSKNKDQCGECNRSIWTSEPSHWVGGDKIHGPGGRGQTGTCLYAHRERIQRQLVEKSREFVEGKISEEDLEELIESIAKQEERMSKKLDRAEEK